MANLKTRVVWCYVELKDCKVLNTWTYGSLRMLAESKNVRINGVSVSESSLRRLLKKNNDRIDTVEFTIEKTNIEQKNRVKN